MLHEVFGVLSPNGSEGRRQKTAESSVKQQIVDMALNGSGVRDTARVLGIGLLINRLEFGQEI